MRPPGCFVFVWVFMWATCTLVGDVFLAWALAQQARAATFPTTDGVITRSAVKTTRGGDGPSHQLDVAYDYEVGGRRHTGTRYSYSEMGTSSREWHKVRDELPVGARVPVAYDPDDPADALLRPGLTGFHLMMVWFLTPFNVVMLGGWRFFIISGRPAFGPRTVAQTPNGWRVRLPGIGRAGLFGAILLRITFAGVFGFGFTFGFNPPVWLAGGGYAAAVALAAYAAARHAPPWLEVDEIERVVRLPAGGGPAAEVSFAAVREVVVTDEETRDSDGDVTRRYHCELVRTGAPPARAATYQHPVAAEALAAWLRERVGLDPA